MRVKKSEIRSVLKKTRTSMRMIEDTLKRPGPLDDEDLDDINQLALELVGDGGMISELVGGD